MHTALQRTVVVCLILAIAVSTALGKIRFAMNPIIRSLTVNTFVRDTQRDGHLDAGRYWEMRDFVGATSAQFHPDSIAHGKPFLEWQSPYMYSADTITDNPPDLSRELLPSGGTVIFQGDDTRIVRSGHTITIEYVSDIETLRNVNGYVGYHKLDISSDPNQRWYSKTVITI